MRKVEIVKEPGAQRCWVAVDFASRERVLQVHDRHYWRDFAGASVGWSSRTKTCRSAQIGLPVGTIASPQSLKFWVSTTKPETARCNLAHRIGEVVVSLHDGVHALPRDPEIDAVVEAVKSEGKP